MLKGIDVSSNNGSVDWKKVAQAGAHWAGIKATEGVDWVDSTFTAGRLREMRQAGVVPMPYHYLRFRNDRQGKDEARHFVETVKKAGWRAGRDLPLCVDIEWIGNEDYLRDAHPAQVRSYASSFCTEVKRLTTRGCIVYLSPAFAVELGSRAPTNGGVSWVAAWDAPDGNPPTPRGFLRRLVLFHQTSDHGHVDGVGAVDTNVFIGSSQDLKALIEGKPRPGQLPKPAPSSSEKMSTKDVQLALVRIGWPIKADGKRGPKTIGAIMDFQRGYTHKKLVVDGVVGTKTAAALRATVKAHGHITTHFRWAEFASKKTGWIKVDRELAIGLEKLRRELGRPIGILSAYRDYIVVGQASDSQHKYGNAVDPTAHLGTVKRVARLGIFSGIGYDDAGVRHVDVRHVGPNTTGSSTAHPAIWRYV